MDNFLDLVSSVWSQGVFGIDFNNVLIGILILIPITRIFILGLIFSYLRPLGQGTAKNKSNEDWIEGEYRKDK